jgi:hypothetical protein
LAATILLLGLTVLVQAITGHTVAVQVIVGLALVAALLTFLPRVTDVERFAMNRSGVTLDLVRGQVAEANAKLDRFIFLAMPKPTYANLVKLAGPQRFGRYNITEGFQHSSDSSGTPGISHSIATWASFGTGTTFRLMCR